MSEVTLTILERDRAIHGRVHGSDAERAIAALTAEPETIQELDVAMRRFTEGDDRSHFAHFRPGDSDEPWDAGVVVIDLAARLLAGESSYSAISTSGSVLVSSSDELIRYELSDDWHIAPAIDCWRGAAERRRAERERQPRLDARQILFGRPMLEFIIGHMANTRGSEACQAVVRVHAEWLTTARDDLGGKTPRDVLLERHDFVMHDLQSREFQWSGSGKCPPGLDRNTDAYRFAGFGTHEIVVYYDMMRFLLCQCRERMDQEGDLNQADEVGRLERLRDAWLEEPAPEFHGRTPASVIDNERRRIPEGVTGAEAAVDPDCPCCQAMAEDFGPYFWGLDGSHMDDEFAFSMCQSREEWEEEQRAWEQFNREFEEKEARRKLDRDEATRIWTRTFTNEELLDDMPLGQFVPIAIFGFGAMVGELNQDILVRSGEDGPNQQEALNRLLGNLRAALGGSPELIDPTLDRLAQELADVAAQYPDIAEKCADLSRRLTEFPSKLAAAVQRDELPF